MLQHFKAFAVLTLLVISVAALVAEAVVFQYIEDFTTTDYKDYVNTTAWWDTQSGELKLYPFVPTLAGSYNTSGNAQDVYIEGDYAFVADLLSGLQIISIANLSGPVLVGAYTPANPARAVHVAGDIAFMACDHGGIWAIDISDPTTPVAVGQEDPSTDAYDIYVEGDHAFVADYWSGLLVYDVSDPTYMPQVGSYNTPGFCQGVCVSGDHAFLADGVNGLVVVDISNPASPALAGHYDTPGSAADVFVSGNHAYVADGYSGGLQVIDITNPSSPTLEGTYSTPDSATGVFVSGDRAYVADGLSGFLMLDITNPAAPVLSGSYDTPGHASGVFVAGDHAYVADDTDGIQVIDISELIIPPILSGTCGTPHEAEDVHVAGNHAFVADDEYGLRVVDISNPSAPVLVGSYDPGYAFAVDVSGDHAYVANWGDLAVIDISGPTSPTLTGNVNLSPTGMATGIRVSGDHAFAAVGYSGLVVVDISNPAIPVVVGGYQTVGSASRVDVSGDYAFLAGGGYGLYVINISNPAAPTLVGSYDTPHVCVDVCVSGDHAYVADSDAGLVVVDVSNPTAPTQVGSYDTPGFAIGVEVSGDYVFVADKEGGLIAINISNPAAPTFLGVYNTPGLATKVCVSGDHAFVADSQSGLQSIQVYQSEFRMYDNIGRSFPIVLSSEPIVSARFTTSQTASVTWEFSTNAGSNWQGISPDGNWNQLVTPGTAPVWRSTHTWVPGLNPTVSQLQIDWLFDKPVIMYAEDVPNDQGGYVLLEWKPSGYDVYDQQTVTHYSVWRALHTVPSTASGLADRAWCSPADIVEKFQGPAYRFGQGYYWEWLTNITAYYFDGYAYAAPTYYDSTAGDPGMHYFQVIAHSSDQWVYWTSRVDSGYSVDNLAPCVPQGFVVVYNTGNGNALSWEESPDEDFQCFRIYRSTDPDFVPSPDDLVGATSDINWNDPEYDGWNVYYKITAVDFSGNESDPASAGTVSAVTEPVIPETYVLYQNVPNPFNPTTVIHYDVPEGGGRVTLRIYDVVGRLVRTLVDDHQTVGQKTAIWNAQDDKGRGVASGVYFYKMTALGFEKTRKMILLQ